MAAFALSQSETVRPCYTAKDGKCTSVPPVFLLEVNHFLPLFRDLVPVFVEVGSSANDLGFQETVWILEILNTVLRMYSTILRGIALVIPYLILVADRRLVSETQRQHVWTRNLN